MKHSKAILILIVLGGSIPVMFELAPQFDIPMDMVVIFVIITGLIISSMALWARASACATGEEWWQDDHCSGWRGY